MKTLTYKALLSGISKYPAASIRMREIGNHKIEVLAISNGRVRVIGVIRLQPK